MDYISGWCKSQRKLVGLTAIVTGSNTGIGFETVLDLHCRGARVIMACRNVIEGENARREIENLNLRNLNKTDGKGILVVEKLDLSSLKSVREFSSRILASESTINILVNNAGVMACPEGLTEDNFETHMGTNHYGHALLTLLLLPKLIQSAPSRIVFVSSYLHKVLELNFDDMNFQNTEYDPLKAYCKSKAANVLFAKGLAQKLKEHDINDVTTYSLHPGVINTGIGRHFSSTVWPGTTWIFKNVLSWFAKTPKCGAQTTIYCAVDEACANESGLYYSDCAVIPSSRHCSDDAVAAQLWDHTISALNLRNYEPFDKNMLVIKQKD